ncbi:hypothetical protein [Microcoleus vaginatus]|uniref:hypothetical protein n=1 Tax=Microcoleus vaginatus TaxID=119532 RepID=UPI0016890C3C|nr:hypothetical protein [Microcoleus sp. FACHB-84]MBD2010557.1 hypothetical protein [Microcoleus sp. FACHB-45]
MIRRYIASISTSILKRTCAATALLALTLGCSSTKPPNTAAPSGSIESAVLAPSPTSLLARNPNKSKKSVSVSSCPQNDGFTEAVNFATQASNLAQSANSKQEWDKVAALWVQAVAWMQAVPAGSPRRAFAEKKVIEYMRNLVYSQQQASATRSQASTVSFSSDLLNEQLELYLSYVAAVGPPDVLIVGSSRALQGVDPKQLKQSLAQRGRPGLKVFNFSVNGATAQVVDFQLRRLLKPGHLPQMIVWADGVRGFNSGRDDRTFNSIVDSEGSQLLAAGIRPELPSDEPNEIPLCYRFPQPCANNTFRKALASVDRPFGGGQDAHPTIKFLSSGTGILPVADTHPPIKFLSSGTGILPVAENAARYELKPIAANAATQKAQLIPVSRRTTVAIRQLNQLADSIDSNGFMAISGTYNPNTYYRERAYVSGQYDRDYENFNLGGKQATAFNSVVAFTKARKIPLIFVNLPLTNDYLDGTRLWAEQQFRQRMQQLSRQKGFAFRDLSQRWPGRNDYFFDPSHLNRFGAIAVSRLLAADSSIIWPRPKSSRSDG